MMRSLLIGFCILLCTSIGYAQNYRVESLTVADGLSQGFVICLLQDSRGFIWIGTSNGLNRYDGYQVKRFKADSTTPWAFTAGVIYCMAEDAQGLLWLGTERGLVVLDPYTERFFQITDTHRSLSSGSVVQISIKKDGRISFCYHDSAATSLSMLRPPAELTRLIREGQIRNTDFHIQSLSLAAGGQGPFVWLASSGDTMIAANRWHQFCQINLTTLQVKSVDPRTLPYRRWGKYGLIYDQSGTRGFAFYLHEAPRTPQDSTFQMTDFLQVPGGPPLLCYTGESAVYQLDTVSVKTDRPVFESPDFYRQLRPFIRLDKPVSYNHIVDRVGNIWMGTTGYGVRKISPGKMDFRQYLSTQSFYNFTLLPDGRIWPGFYQPHQVLNLQTNQLEPAPWNNVLSKDIWPHGLLVARSGDWWMMAAQKSQFCILKKDRLSNQWQKLPVGLKFTNSFPIPVIEDRQGNIWIAGAQGEIARVRPKDNQVDLWQLAPFFPAFVVEDLRGTCLVEDAHGTLWIGQSGGLVRVENPDGKPVFQVWHNPTDSVPVFKNDWIMSLYPDPNDPLIIWAGTHGGGLSRFDSQTGRAETFTEENGLADNVVYGILPDDFGHLWLSTNRGLSRFNPRNRTFSNFPNAEPALNIEFNTSSYRRLPSGELAFGSVGGLFVIHPLPERPVQHSSVVEIIQLKINGIVLHPTDSSTGLSFTAQNEISLRVPFDQDNIILEFAALQTDDPASAQYRYRVLGLEEHWILTGHQRTANLVAMPPGEYTIELQSIGTNGNWADAPVTRMYMEILPPWYRSWPAWWLYAGLVSCALYAYIWYERRRVRLKYEVNFSRKEMERLKSLDEFKNRFFGYISHEFKTPLTIIMGHAKRLPETKTHQRVVKKAGIILSQGQSMLEMVNQMVDITKLDNQELQLNWRNGNFSDYVRYLIESLRSLVEFKGLQLHFHSTVPNLMMDFDPLRLKYIVNNLLSNAVQHTPSGGSINVAILPGALNQVQLEVSDTGEGIAPEDLPNIFERYYQGSSNELEPHHFGLGLAFVKDLVQIFAGKIAVSSELDKGATFTLSLPITQAAIPLETYFPENAHFQSSLREEAPDDPGREALPLLLVVEDNPFISNFIQSCLAPYFQLEFVPDGLAGYEKALQIVPDLILTDVMMPYMDGYTLTHQLKNHELTGHIPIVMLSARSGLSDRLAGQQLGADAYVGKPFDEQELVLILQNLHRLQGRWRERYAGLTHQTFPVNDLTKATVEQPDETIRQTDAFMLKIYALFEKNYPDEEYDLPQLCHDIELSKSQLQRKLAALSDQSAMELLRRYRLQKAYEILSDSLDINIKEICFQVGFKDPSHFSRLFSKTFHLAPSEVRKNLAADSVQEN